MVASHAALTHRQFLKIDKNYEAAASAAHLLYVNDRQPGIRRIKKGKGFLYSFNDNVVEDVNELKRIRALVIPPAWRDVWICKSPNGHIQVTGYDVNGRKQYKYHSRWAALQQETKFHRMIEFGKALPLLRRQIEKDITLPGFPEAKVIAMVISVMERTSMRVGSNEYEKRYGSYGLTTLKNKHVVVKGDKVMFSFRGKKGVCHNIALKSKRFAHIIKQCRSIPGSELFQYYDEEGSPSKVDSGQVNQYIKESTGQDFTTKDFRTWAGTLIMLGALRDTEPGSTVRETQQQIVNAFREVSSRLGNTVAVCKKYYVHPAIADLHEKGNLASSCKRRSAAVAGLNRDEKILMRLLQDIQQRDRVLSPKSQLKASIRKGSQKSRPSLPAARKLHGPIKSRKFA